MKPAVERVFGQFLKPDFRVPSYFDELPENELAGWHGAEE
jgi:hypothetical protein